MFSCGACSRADLQRHDLVAVELEDELKVDGTAGEIPGKPVGDDGLAVLVSGRKRLDRVVVLLRRVGLSCADGGERRVSVTFIAKGGVRCKAF
jgi:hypothetical protein